MADCLCDVCAALCCRYFSLPIDNPDTPKDFDDLRWYMLHENVVAFVEDDQWYLGIMNRCKQLQPDNRCGIYETRPRICRKYSTDNCDYHGGDYNFEHLFTSADQLMRFAEGFLEEQREERRKKAKRAKARKGAKGAEAKAAKAAPKKKTKLRRREIFLPPIGQLQGHTGGPGNNGNIPGSGGPANGRGVSLTVLKSRKG